MLFYLIFKRDEILVCKQEYVPDDNGMVAKLSWEKEQQLGHTKKSEIAR